MTTKPRMTRITLPTKADADWKAYAIRGECPICGDPNNLEASDKTITQGYHGDDLYILNGHGRTEALLYELHTCNSCNCQFQAVLAPAAIIICDEYMR